MTRRLTSSSLAGHLAEAGGRRDREAGLHVGDDAGAGAPDGLAERDRRPAWRRSGAGAAGGGEAAGAARRGSRRGGGRGRGAGERSAVTPARAVVGEELLPALAHRGRVGQVLLVHLVDQPGVGADRVGGVLLGSHRCRSYRPAYGPPASIGAQARRRGRAVADPSVTDRRRADPRSQEASATSVASRRRAASILVIQRSMVSRGWAPGMSSASSTHHAGRGHDPHRSGLGHRCRERGGADAVGHEVLDEVGRCAGVAEEPAHQRAIAEIVAVDPVGPGQGRVERVERLGGVDAHDLGRLEHVAGVGRALRWR